MKKMAEAIRLFIWARGIRRKARKKSFIYA